jgi:hypothetical protein
MVEQRKEGKRRTCSKSPFLGVTGVQQKEYWLKYLNGYLTFLALDSLWSTPNPPLSELSIL